MRRLGAATTASAPAVQRRAATARGLRPHADRAPTRAAGARRVAACGRRAAGCVASAGGRSRRTGGVQPQASVIALRLGSEMRSLRRAPQLGKPHNNYPRDAPTPTAQRHEKIRAPPRARAPHSPRPGAARAGPRASASLSFAPQTPPTRTHPPSRSCRSISYSSRGRRRRSSITITPPRPPPPSRR